jgi:carbonic anhydrase/acetyltransferase-like protein (isoleucine patch superfamily)
MENYQLGHNQPKDLIFVGSRSLMHPLVKNAELCGFNVLGILDQYYWGNTDSMEGVPFIGSELQLLDSNDRQGQDWKNNCSFFVSSFWDGREHNPKHPGLDNEQVRKDRISLVESLNVPIANLIHPNTNFTWGQDSITLGHGILIAGAVNIAHEVNIGNHVLIDWGSMIYSYTNLETNSSLGIGSRVGCCTIKENARIGPHAILIPIRETNMVNGHTHMTVGRNSVVWTNAHLYNSVPDDSIYTMHDKLVSRGKITSKY